MRSGFGLLEIIIAIGITSITFVAIAGVAATTLKNIRENENSEKALFYAQEGIEAVRAVKDKGWVANIGTLTFGASYHPAISGSSWSLASGAETIGIFTRTIVISNVSRDPGTKDIEQTYNAGNNNTNTKKVTSTVSWPGKSIYLTAYITNILGN